MITFFTIPKSFDNPHINTIQRNAINSWKKIHLKVEVFLFSDDNNINSISNELDVKAITNLNKNENGI